jgi:hypothetical protein
MPKPTIRIHDLATNEIIDREMTAGEIADHEAAQAASLAAIAETEAKAVEKTALLAKLGLTADEAKLLLS